MRDDGTGRRTTKGDLKKKRLARGYKRGGKFRTQEMSENGSTEKSKDKGKKKLKKY